MSGRAVGRELAGTERLEASGLGPQPAYSSADRNLKATAQIAGELEALKGDELRERTRRMRDLLAAASRQQQAESELPQQSGYRPATTAGRRPDRSKRRQAQASSPHGSRARDCRSPPAARSRRDEPTVNSRREEHPRANKPAVSERLGPRLIAEDDARHRIEQL